jgi:arabinan endo-1,5-alpha-L-arabinosidase
MLINMKLKNSKLFFTFFKEQKISKREITLKIMNIFLLLIISNLIASQDQPGNLAQKAKPTFYPNSPNVHDPVMAKCGDIYYVFATGNGISTLKSKDLKIWEKGKSVFETAPEWTKEAVPNFKGHIWAPDIIFYQGKYHIFYSCSNMTGKNNAAIGHASNPTLDEKSPEYKWTDHGKIVQSVVNRDMWQAIDPNIIIDEKGTPWFIFGSFWDGIKAVKMTKDMMGFEKPEEWHTVARRPTKQPLYTYSYEDSQIEGAFIYKHGDIYYLFASFDMCCRGLKSNYHIMVGRSKEVTGPYLDRAGFSMLDGGGTPFAIGDGKKWAALGHNSVYNVDGKDILFAHGYSIPHDGASELIVSEIKWDSEGWPMFELK